MIFHYYSVEMHFWKKKNFIPNRNGIFATNILKFQLIYDDDSTSIEDVRLSNVKSYVIIGY